ncbi:hypothetical protein CIW54_07465 [Paraburkholderia sp. T12-10]|nr:hypothetical protein CIW54_07465 [Paraburkholderia sp. T12-10]
MIEAIAFGAILGLAICYAVGRWWPKTEAERTDYEALEREHFGDPDKHTGIYAPKRAVQFRVEIQADDLGALASALSHLSMQADRQRLSTHSVSGGYDSGYEHWLTVSDEPTHDEYVKQIKAWLESQK